MGKLIVLEGLDGAGKTTQLGLLCGGLAAEGRAFRKLEFPCYGEESSALVRMYLAGQFGGGAEDVNAFAASSFYAVDRYASYKTHWEGDYARGLLFVSGRYTTSNAIHQGAKLPESERGAFMDWLFDYEYRLLGLPKPDLVLFLDVDTQTSLRNIEGRKGVQDIHEKDAEYLKKCRESALYAAARYGWHRVDCQNGEEMRPPEEIYREIYKVIRENLC